MRGGCVLCNEVPRPPLQPAPQGFLQSKNALRRRKTVGLLPGSLIVVRAANRFAIADQKESAGKNRRSARQGRHCLTRTTGIAQGSADPCVFTRQRKIAVSSRRLDTALLCAAKKRGVEKGPAGRSLPEPPLVPGPRVQSKSLSLPQAAKKGTHFRGCLLFLK